MSRDYFPSTDTAGNARDNKTSSELRDAFDRDEYRYSFTYACGGGAPGTLYFRRREDRDAFRRVFARLDSYVFHGQHDSAPKARGSEAE
jgi:hypothetical protein